MARLQIGIVAWLDHENANDRGIFDYVITWLLVIKDNLRPQIPAEVEVSQAVSYIQMKLWNQLAIIPIALVVGLS